ncbi:hypothetical protein MED217_01300 [Leeuwenhoekiella blandensis MED217]|uniref:Uncharacterized protein n=1 Tax=Leeuwenhoekiella blandensis (strain CECT 7118 / CCUG 51940 / KCTC 22103 / MED217) TaxID=398720 RepID=A3XL25_LEEBM|nr:hypothetical protein MED217_01300 [Leeuwenhoekiella blandensis MED217]
MAIANKIDKMCGNYFIFDKNLKTNALKL